MEKIKDPASKVVRQRSSDYRFLFLLKKNCHESIFSYSRIKLIIRIIWDRSVFKDISKWAITNNHDPTFFEKYLFRKSLPHTLSVSNFPPKVSFPGRRMRMRDGRKKGPGAKEQSSHGGAHRRHAVNFLSSRQQRQTRWSSSPATAGGG